MRKICCIMMFLIGLCRADEMLLDLEVILPADGPGVEEGVVVARLYAYNPMLAGAPAKELSRETQHGVQHVEGKETRLKFQLSAKPLEHSKYYITVFVHPKEGEKRYYFINGFQKVFEQGYEQELEVTLTPVRNDRKEI